MGRTLRVYSNEIVPGPSLLETAPALLDKPPREKTIMQIKTRLASAMRRLDQLKNQNKRSADFDLGQSEEKIFETDDYLAKKLLWTVAIGGSAVFFIGLPLLLMVLQIIMPMVIMQILWLIAKIGMTLVLVVFGYAVYMTLVKSDN